MEFKKSLKKKLTSRFILKPIGMLTALIFMRTLHTASISLCCNCVSTNFSEIPVNFDRYDSCSWEPLADRDIIDQHFHHFTGKAFRICVLLDDLTAVIALFDLLVDLGESPFAFFDSVFETFLFQGEIFRKLRKSSLGNNSFYLV